MSDIEKRKQSLPCDVCGDSAAIVVPSREGSVKRFPCPQCSPLTNIAHVMSIGASVMLNRAYMDQEAYKKKIRADLVEALADAMVTQGHIKFVQSEPNKQGDVFIRAYTALVAPNIAPKLEARIAERQRDIADAWCKRAIQMVIDCGPQIDDVMSAQLYKATVIDILRDAVDAEVAARRETELPPLNDSAQR